MKNLTRLILIILILFAQFYVFGNGIVVETRDGGLNKNNYKEISGNWFDSVGKSLVEGVTPGIGSRFLTIDGPSPTGSFEVTPFIPSAGQYEISVTFGTSGNVENCKFILEVNGAQVKTGYFNQRGWGSTELNDPGNANVWISLGIFDLPQGDKTKLIISADEVKGKADSKNNGRLYADAIKFSPPSSQGSSAPTPSDSTSAFQQTTQVQQTTNSPFALDSKTDVNTNPFQAPQTSQQSAVQTPSALVSNGPVSWMADYTEAIKEGTRQNKPILLFFYSEMGRLSIQMENQILYNTSVLPYLQNFICCKIQITDTSNARLSEYYEVFKAPTLIFLNPQGYMKGREDKTIDVAAMITLLQSMK